MSAFNHCRFQNSLDPLCAWHEFTIDSQEAPTIARFARHWGNYMMRELMLYPPIQHAALPDPRALIDANGGTATREQNKRTVWWLLKQASNSKILDITEVIHVDFVK